MKHLLSLAAALALSACITAPVPKSSIRDDGLATLGQPTRVGALVVTPLLVVEDSRCPLNVVCVWAGRLAVKTRIDGTGWSETVDLALGQLHAAHGTRLMLVSAEPGKVAGAPTPPATLFGFELR